MKMKTYRKLMKHPPYKHTCACQGEGQCEYLTELPDVQGDCLGPKYWKRVGDTDNWVDVTDTIPVSPWSNENVGITYE
jgi:hypothetical protein